MAGPTLIDKTGNSKIIEVLSSWGINLYAGVNGGGVIHLAKYLLPFEDLSQANDNIPRLLNIPEHIAGYVPLGHYLASGRIAAALFTTGGATLLGASGMLDAKLHDIPAVYLIALNATTSLGRGPLQDMTPDGLNAISTIKGLYGERCLVINDIGKLKEVMEKAQKLLKESMPVAILFYPDVLSKETSNFTVPWIKEKRDVAENDLNKFLSEFPKQIKGKRVVIYVGEEATRYKGINEQINNLSEILKAPVIYSMNGVNAVSSDNKYAAGYIHFGFNDWAKQLWDSLSIKDVVVVLGFDAGEYEMNMGNIAANVWHFTNLASPYGSKNGNFRHRVDGSYNEVRGEISLALSRLMPKLREKIHERQEPKIPSDLNSRQIEKPGPQHADFVEFYKNFSRLLRQNRKTIIINDVCQAYKDFQYVTQRPIDGVEVYSAHRGSVMGHSLGMGIGAKIASPEKNVHVFAGDGCFAYFGGALAYARDFCINMWVVDNKNYHIVDKGLDVVMPNIDRQRHHSKLPEVDFAGVAEKFGWQGYHLEPGFGNLREIMNECNSSTKKSVLVQIPVDGNIVIGQNPRLLNLRRAGGVYL